MKNAQDNLIIFSLLSFFLIYFQTVSLVFQSCNFEYSRETIFANDVPTYKDEHQKKTAEAAFFPNYLIDETSYPEIRCLSNHSSRAHDICPHALSQNSPDSIAHGNDKQADDHIH